MGFQVSPGVNVTEIDLTTIVPAVASTSGGIAGVFQWGPVEEITLVDSVNVLKSRFGGPDDDTYEYFFTAANFLGYGNSLQVVRAVGTDAKNAVSTGGTARLFKNEVDFETNKGSGIGQFFAKYPGVLGNSISVYGFDGGAASDGEVGVTIGLSTGIGTTVTVGSTQISIGLGTTQGAGPNVQKGDVLQLPSGQRVLINETAIGITSPFKLNTAISTEVTNGAGVTLQSRYSTLFPRLGTKSVSATGTDVENAGGTNDLFHLAVVDHDGKWTGEKGTVLETFESVSKATDSKKFDGSANFYKDIINEESQYIWADDDLAGVCTGTKSNTTFGSITANTDLTSSGAYGVTLAGGTAAKTAAETALYTAGYSKFEDSEVVDVSLLLSGPASATVQGLLVDLCDQRKDCIAFLSPNPLSDYKNKSEGDASKNAVNYRNNSLNKNSSYAVLDTGFKYMYDQFNGVYRYVPLNGDIAGLLARTERENEAWFSPAGFNRGQIRGVVKLAFNPRQAQRDDLYQAGINPVVSFPGEGTILFGDKTLQSKPSAFDRINVRRLFIILEKAIATAAKFQLFEFNDEFTRSQFRNLVVPFLRDVQSRRGVTDFKVVCDESNNPGSVIDRNEFVADIYIKPNRSINFIQLNFIATPSGVSFEEVGG